jgi:SAM-dependent methyltransferase
MQAAEFCDDEPDLDFPHDPTTYATHGLHPFAAKCPPPLANWIIRRWSREGDWVLDPLAGSGTTLVEAQLLGRKGLGVEIDPLARLLCRVKTTPLPPELLHRYCAWVLSTVEAHCDQYRRGHRSLALPTFPGRDYWFLPEVAAHLAIIKGAITALPAPMKFKRFFYVALSSLILARTSVANARDIVHSRPHHVRHPTPPDVLARFRQRLVRMQAQMDRFVGLLSQMQRPPAAQIVGDDARTLPLADATVDLVLTSPPYCNALDYTRAHALAIAWLADVLAIDLEAYRLLGRRYIGSDRAACSYQGERAEEVLQIPLVRQIVTDISARDHQKGRVVQRYFADMWRVLGQIGRVLRPGGHAALVVCPSNIRKMPIPTHRAFVHMAQDIRLPGPWRFELVFQRDRTINDRRRLMPYMGMQERMRTEYVLIFQKVPE